MSGQPEAEAFDFLWGTPYNVGEVGRNGSFVSHFGMQRPFKKASCHLQQS